MPSLANWKIFGFGLYIHWPFCQSLCPYCDFNSYIYKHIDYEAWQQAFIKEMHRAYQRTENRTLKSIFFGGGTPSLMHPQTVKILIKTAQILWKSDSNIEITLEANPGSIDRENIASFAAAGINRISLGIQALNDNDLKRLGRRHTVAQAKSVFKYAKQFFQKVSFDLIYARQNQTVNDWHDELCQALDMHTDHLSLYQLTIEPGTRFNDLYAKGRLTGLPTDEKAALLYEITQNLCNQARMPAYEISNHAAVGAECRHNLIYWRAGDYIGIGPGAHGRLTLNNQRIATVSISNPQKWLATATQGNASCDQEIITPENQAAEYLMLSLRLNEGCSLQRFARLNQTPLDSTRIKYLCKDGLILQKNDKIIATAKGRLMLNRVLCNLLI